MTRLFILFEHSAGYALFKVREFEEIGALLPQVEQSITDLSRFGKIITLHAQTTFENAIEALESINCISEGILPEGLKLFLELQFPKISKRSKYTLGVMETKLAANISELLNISCMCSNVKEIHRGIRIHFHHLLENFTPKSSSLAQLGLAHSYSRTKIKFNIHKADIMVIQSIALLDQLDKNINTMTMRIREWYAYHFPELFKIVSEYNMYTKSVKFIGSRKTLSEDKLEQLEEIVMDSAKARAILDASRSSMGMDISPLDLLNIDRCASRVIGLIELRASLLEYLKNKLNAIAPNLCAILGEQVSARLISKAGSLTNLAKTPASTIQILGAEKALFRALKTRGKTPKYGLLYNTTYISKAAVPNKGRISRLLANKCSMASRIDCFSEIPSNIFGEKLKSQIEQRLKFYETGDVPSKNVDVMKEALNEYNDYKNTVLEASQKKKKKKKKRMAENLEASENDVSNIDNEVSTTVSFVDEEVPLKKKKKKSQSSFENSRNSSFLDETINRNPKDDLSGLFSVVDEEVPLKKKKKKSQSSFENSRNSSFLDETINRNPKDDLSGLFSVVDEEVPLKKKKKKSQSSFENTRNSSFLDETINRNPKDDLSGLFSVVDEEVPLKKKKKKSQSSFENSRNSTFLDETINRNPKDDLSGLFSVADEEVPLKKKKKKSQSTFENSRNSTFLDQTIKRNPNEDLSGLFSVVDEEVPLKKKKKKSQSSFENSRNSTFLDEAINQSPKGDLSAKQQLIKNKKKKKRSSLVYDDKN